MLSFYVQHFKLDASVLQVLNTLTSNSFISDMMAKTLNSSTT